LHYVIITVLVEMLCECVENLNGQTDETFALRIHFTKELQRPRSEA